MASPQESITTVSGRRCTRSRARTAATSTSIPTPVATSVVAPTNPVTSTVVEQTPETQPAAPRPTASQAAPPPPAPPLSSSQVEQPALATTPVPTSQAAVSSAAGTGNAVLISLATSSPAVSEPSAPAPAPAVSTPSVPLQPSAPAVASSQVSSQVSSQLAATPTLPPARIAPTSSDNTETAVIGPSSLSVSSPSPSAAPVVQPAVSTSPGSVGPTSSAAVPDIIQTVSSSQTLSPATSIAELLSQTSSAALGESSREAVGIIAPEQGAHSGGDGHTGEAHSSHSGSDPNMGGIVGGVVGGFVGLALLGALLFFFLRRRKSKQSGWDEKSEDSSDFISKLKAVPAGFGVLLAKLRNEKAGPLDNPYQRHQPRSSVSSIYSTSSSGRGRSISESQGQSAVGGGFMRRMSSKKSERNVLRKKTSSASSQTPFMGILEEPVRNSNVGSNPFADPGLETPRKLRISNPGAAEEQTDGPSPPQPAATPRVARDPFASLIDEIDGAPNWLRDSNMTAGSASNHRRTQSTASALPSNPSSSVYSSNPFVDPPPMPPIPNQTSTTNKRQPPLTTYSPFPAPRESKYPFFGEPGPSRPSTTMFTPGLPSNPGASRPGTKMFNTAAITPGLLTSGLPTSTSRMDRQSDPFDLDRPEVLSFKGIMNQMRDSLARQTTIRSRRTSSVGNWFGRDSSMPSAVNGGNVRR
ncbi:hypothetical protein EJ07DRAFT_153919 [Lizonia empirigonia]|nr:hypothetical protein EJ07DRAFT_153919 [Lizonia empirigonia]